MNAGPDPMLNSLTGKASSAPLSRLFPSRKISLLSGFERYDFFYLDQISLIKFLEKCRRHRISYWHTHQRGKPPSWQATIMASHHHGKGRNPLYISTTTTDE